MPRAFDPSLPGGGLPITHSPLNRIRVNPVLEPFDLQALIDQLLISWENILQDSIFPAIESLTGIDLSILLTLLDELALDFSSPTALLLSLIDAAVALPGVILQVVVSIFNQILEMTGIDLNVFLPLLNALSLDFSSPEAFLASLFTAAMAIPAILSEIMTGVVEKITEVTGIDLAVFLPLWQDLDFSNPVAFFISLGEAMISVGAALLGPNSPLNAENLFNNVLPSVLGHVSASSIGTAITNLITDPFFLNFGGMEEWLSDLTGGFDGLGAASVLADGFTHELLGNLIHVSEGQVLPLSGMAKWTGLAGSGLPIALGVIGYITGSASTVESTIASRGVSPPTTDWVELAGSYTVPANVSSLRTRLIVGSGATAGQVWFSNLSATKNQPLLQRLIAGTDPGEFLPDDISNLFSGIISNTLEIVNKAGLADFNDLVSTLIGSSGTVSARLNSFLTSLSILNGSRIGTGSIADQFVPGISSIIDTIVKSINNIGGSGFDYPDLFESFENAAFSLTDHASGISNLFTRMGILESEVNEMATAPDAPTGGQGTADGGAKPGNDSDTFERTSSTSLGTNWGQAYSGSGGVWATPNGHDASFVTSGFSTREFICIRNNPSVIRSKTDFQRVTMTLSSAAASGGFNDIWLRVSDSSSSLSNITGIRIRFGGNGTVSIYRFNSGSGVELASTTITKPGPGSSIIGEAGDFGGTARFFRAKVGQAERLSVTELGGASGLGIAFRRWGHGGRAEGILFPFAQQAKPGSVNSWSGMDQTSGSSGGPGVPGE